MSVCPSCNQQSSDAGALFCPYCGFALPDAEGASPGLQAFAVEPPPVAADAVDTQRWRGPSWASDANPRAVAVGLGALLTAAVLAIGLSYGSSRPDHVTPPAAAPSARRNGAQTPTAGGNSLPANAQAPPRPVVHMTRYRASGYSFAYPSGWRISQSDRPLATYRETVLQSADGAAKVNVDYSPGETTDPSSKASQVEAPTSSTPGYQRISYGPAMVNGHAAFAWEFIVDDADPRRADLFIRTPTGDFAFLAHGRDFARARSAARLVAGSLYPAR